jgi:hypothetical protein
MMGSPWDGFSRWPLRVGLALIAAFGLLGAALDVHDLSPSAISHPAAPRLLLALGRSTIVLGVLVALGLYAAFEFARRRASLLAGLGMTAILGILSEAIGALARSPQRGYFSLGAALYGWLGGLAYARLLRKAPCDADEELAEAGAAAGIAATYVNAAISKGVSSGLAWIDTSTLRAVVVSHHRVDDRSLLGLYAGFVVDHPSFSRALLAATLVLQAGAFLYTVSRTSRMVWGTALLVFHTNVSFLAHIGYSKARMLLLLFSFPWPRLWQRVRGPSGGAAPATAGPTPAAHPHGNRRAVTVLLFAFLLLASLGWLLPIRGYTSLHGHHDGGPPATSGQSATGGRQGLP